MFGKKKKKEEESHVPKRDLEEENRELYSKLTNKNQDYFFQLNGRLDELSYEESKKKVVLNQLLKETVEFQEEAITARRMYGTVTEQADKIIKYGVKGTEEQGEMSPIQHLYLDNALLLGGLFNIINGVTVWRNPNQSVSLFQLILNFLLGGLVALTLLKYRPANNRMVDILKYSIVTVGVMLLWIFTMQFADLVVPPVINPNISAIWVVSVGALGILARWYLRKKLDIKGSLF